MYSVTNSLWKNWHIYKKDKYYDIWTTILGCCACSDPIMEADNFLTDWKPVCSLSPNFKVFRKYIPFRLRICRTKPEEILCWFLSTSWKYKNLSTCFSFPLSQCSLSPATRQQTMSCVAATVQGTHFSSRRLWKCISTISTSAVPLLGQTFWFLRGKTI